MLELLLATTMLMVFTGTLAAVMEVTLNIMGEAECPVGMKDALLCNDKNAENVSNGVLIDRQQIELLFDQMENVLVQPGIHRSRIRAISKPVGALPGQPWCTLKPTTSSWTSTVPELPVLTFPPGYHLCLWQMGLPESSMEDLLDTNERLATPGLYVLQALPTKLNAAAIPVRRLICRPRPFC